MKFKILSLLLFGAFGCAVQQKSVSPAATGAGPATVSQLKFLDEYEIPFDLKYENTWVGGLSGIDYDRRNDRYFIISDERSATSPSRFYTARIRIAENRIDTVIFTGVQSLKMPGGKRFPSLKEGAQEAADPESIRFNAATNSLIWSSEGDRAQRNGGINIKDPWIWKMDLNGNYLDSFSLPSNLHVQTSEQGPRVNGVFEGLGFAADYRILFASVEEPLYEDGPRADVDYPGAPVRILKYNVATGKPVAQYAYLLDAVARKPHPDSAFRVNGISEILPLDDHRLLVMERSFSMGNSYCTIKIYEATLKDATDVSGRSGLHLDRNYRPASKKLLLNMNDLNRYIDNVEGITFGPKLANGHYSVILIADNNFSREEKTQVFLFEAIP
ncbi:esterase-like activity of phytase family protein [Niabella beijingensis]|uniref:esterase-like activity of phytase family protein n=1 Tax=Niabella beijingensis TaxID=2872700 RepID=UPI001CBD5353|nr:esterase-like activity of phytase family protein [Niabella beijingensis]MBZ4191231.1 esterase-like activity of phytase family protein [Niabella beijingensis]